uniref:Uncharacterized protein n=1 Tax=Arundo donax TaxID=35708 RepID=A0A0A9HN93_ARUDO
MPFTPGLEPGSREWRRSALTVAPSQHCMFDRVMIYFCFC